MPNSEPGRPQTPGAAEAHVGRKLALSLPRRVSVLIWLNWPSVSVWAIGMLVGVKLMISGISRLLFGVATAGTASAHSIS